MTHSDTAEAGKPKELTDEQIGDICETAVSCADADMKIANQYDLEGDELEELLLDNEIERCKECGWWCKTYDLIDDETDEAIYICSECRS